MIMPIWTQARVLHIKTETPWVRTITLSIDPKIISLKPGDAIEIQTRSHFKKLVGYYSLSKINTDSIEITLKRSSDKNLRGLKRLFNTKHLNMAQHLHFSKIGTPFEIRKLEHPEANYSFNPEELNVDNPDESLFFISGGLGITPNMAILRHLIAQNWHDKKSIVFIYSIQSTEDFVFREELQELEKAHKSLKLIVVKTREKPSVVASQSLNGNRIGIEFLKTRFKNKELKNSKFFICGSRAFSKAMLETLSQLGVPQSSIRSTGN